MKKIHFSLDIIIEIGWLAIFLLSPIYFDTLIYQPFPTAWQVSFYTLLQITLFFWLIKIIFNFSEFKNEFKKRVKYILPFFIFLIFVFISTLLSRSLSFSFWGSYERCFGFLTWLHLFLFYCLLIFNLKTKDQLTKLIGVIFGTTFFICLYGVIQLFGFDFIKWEVNPSESYRIFSSLGQPNFLASWLLLVLPLISLFFFYCFNFWRKEKKSILFPFFAFLMFLFVFFVLIFTQSRGAWLGFLSQILILYFFLLWYFKKRRLFCTSLIIVLGLGLILIGLNIYHFNSPINESLSPIIGRLESLVYLGGATGRLRLYFWQDGLELISKKPFFGYGPETQRFYYISYYRPEFAALEAINSYPDRAHNDIIDTLLTTGFFGLISYLLFIGSSFYFGIKQVLKKLDFSGLFILALLLGVFGYLVSLQFSFHFFPTAVYFVGFLAIGVVIGVRPSKLVAIGVRPSKLTSLVAIGVRPSKLTSETSHK